MPSGSRCRTASRSRAASGTLRSCALSAIAMAAPSWASRTRDDLMRPLLSRLRLPILAFAALAAACGDVQVATDVDFPKPLVVPMPVKMGIYYSDQFSKYLHQEERWGTDWKIELGPFHVKMTQRLFNDAFAETVTVKDLNDIPAGEHVSAVVEPRIEQYSFITPRDTGAKYYAVTIRYRLNVFAPNGQLADSLTFTGYGSSPSSGVTTTNPMMLATKAAMRDAAAKFLVQFPDQEVSKKMLAGTPLIDPNKQVAEGGGTSSTPGSVIESVPIIDPQETVPTAGQTPPPTGTPPTNPTETPPPQGAPTPEPPVTPPSAEPKPAAPPAE